MVLPPRWPMSRPASAPATTIIRQATCWSSSGFTATRTRRNCPAARPAAGQLRRVLVAVKPELLQHVACLIMVVAGAEAGLDIGQRGGKTIEIRLLRQVAHGGAGLHEAAAAV